MVNLSVARIPSLKLQRRNVFGFGVMVMLLMFAGVCSSPSHAGQITNLAEFNWDNGYSPTGHLVLDSSTHTLYGTANSGGANGYGNIFAVGTNGNNFHTVYSFTSADGYYPGGDLTLSNGVLYGVTGGGGAAGNGAVYSVTTGGTDYQTLLSFTGSSGDRPGQSPSGELELVGSTLYGTTTYGGANGKGTVFSVNTNGNGYIKMIDFMGNTGAVIGANPDGNLTAINGVLYGTTASGGQYGKGTIWAIGTGGFVPVRSFEGLGGEQPNGGLSYYNGKLYGTTSAGGLHGDGTVFSLDLSNGAFTPLFSFNGSNGYSPNGVTVSGGKLYGTTVGGGSQYAGNLYSMNLDGFGFEQLAEFNWDRVIGDRPFGAFGGLIVDGNMIYGTTQNGGPDDCGTVFSYNLPEPAPEPSAALLLLGLGVSSVAALRRRSTTL